MNEKDRKNHHVTIARELHREIKYAQENLNNTEKNKPKGYKKKHWTFIATSREIGKFLYNQRGKSKK